jgi:hypothetical protein
LPWRLGDVLGLYITLSIGGILLLVAWWGASSTPRFSSQIAWVNVGVVGLIVAGFGGAVWLLTGRRAVGERVARVIPGESLSPTFGTQASNGGVRLVAGRRMTRYHRPDCQLVAGKNVGEASLADHRAAGRRPCGVCLGVAETKP